MPRAREFRVFSASVAAAFVAVAPMSAGAQTTDQCVTAFDEGQSLRDAMSLRRARERFALCSKTACPNPLRADCAEALAALSRDLPSIVPGARRADGSDIGHLRIFIDQQRVAVTPGAALDVDPGRHSLRIESSGYITVSTDLVVRIGERNRPVILTMQPSDAASSDGGDDDGTVTRRSPWTWPLAGLGVAALGSFAYFGLNGLSDRDAAQSCAPRCPDHYESRVRTQFIAADVSLGIGVIALVGATYLFFATATQEAR